MKLSGIYGIFVGLMMLTQWVFFLATNQVPELQTEPWRIALHLVAEFITAVGLIISGGMLIKHTAWGARSYLFFSGMLVYSVIASPGYFAQQQQWVLVAMFIFLLVLSLVFAKTVANKS